MPIKEEEIIHYVEMHIGNFHDKRLESLKNLKLSALLQRKNPYLFKSKNMEVAADLVRALLDAHLSSQEESLFGAFLEGFAIYVAEATHKNAGKSSADGIDLEFEKDGTRHMVSIKSGPNWGNSSQIKKMEECFKKAQKIFRQGNPQARAVAVNGCCYGRGSSDTGAYFKYCGQDFWALISGEDAFYTRIVEPLGYKARQRNADFRERYAQMINRFTGQFVDHFCAANGAIDWEKLVAFNSSREKPGKLAE